MEKIFTEIRYHPLLENFPEYESLRREPVPYNESDKFVFPNFMMPGREESLVKVKITDSASVCFQPMIPAASPAQK